MVLDAPLRLVLAGSCMLAVGCTVDLIGDPLGGGDPTGDGSGGGGDGSGGGGSGGSTSDELEGKLSNNGLLFSPLAIAELPLDGLGTRASDEEVIADPIAVDALVEQIQGVEHLRYAALCALDEGDNLIVETAAGVQRYPGLYGLAPGWAEGPCDGSCQRWMTGCLLAHTNKIGATVPISLRGQHPGFEWDDNVAAAYPLQEAAFYGNAFTGVTEGVFPTLYACFGRALIDFSEEEDAEEFGGDYLQERVCSTGDCGFYLAGPCRFDEPGGSTCGQDAGVDGYFGNCKGSWIAEDRDAGDDPIYPEVVTTYLVVP